MSGLTFEEMQVVLSTIQARRDAEQQRKRQYGEVRPTVHLEYSGHQLVAAGGTLHISPRWKTFPDFLTGYTFRELSLDWYAEERAKPPEDRNQILHWYDAFIEAQQAIPQHDGAISEFVPDGLTEAHLNLAYDLYTVRNNQILHSAIIERLKKQSQFQGARYELFVAALMTRAGFEISFEDESDCTKSHPEFVAVHRLSGQRLAVEAKSRHRQGVYGFEPAKPQAKPELLKVGVLSLLERAARKMAVHPLVVFIDVNLPHEFGAPGNPWVTEIDADIEAIASQYGGEAPFAAALFTNTPHGYTKTDRPGANKSVYMVSDTGRVAHPEVFESIGRAFLQYGNIPNKFPVEQT